MIEDQLLRFERLIPTKDVHVLDQLLPEIKVLQKCLSQGSLLQKKYPGKKVDEVYTRIAAKILSVLQTHPAKLTREHLQRIAELKPTICYIFFASGFRSTSPLLRILSESSEGSKINIKKDKLLLYLSLVSIEDLTDELLGLALHQPSEVLFYLMTGWLSERAILSDQGEKNRTRLLASGQLLVGYKLAQSDLGILCRVWMYCSYATSSRKHDIKYHLNALLKSYLYDNGILDTRNFEIPARSRKRICIILERFKSHHAMYRCYAQSIIGLKDEFEIIGLGDEAEFDEQSKSIFHETHLFDYTHQSISDIVKQIRDLSPDIIYYPSVGMSLRVMMLANLRLAPKQIATLGHPATINSGMIDSVYAGNAHPVAAQCFSENIKFQKDDFVPIDLHPQLSQALSNEDVLDMPIGVNIAVNCKVMKLSNAFIKMCKRLQEEVGQTLNFHFFPGELGMHHDGLAASLKNHLDNVYVYGYLPYHSMMHVLRHCKVSLVSYPFGNANGAFDCAIFGVPSVFMSGAEIHSQSDEMMLRSVGAPIWGAAKDESEYFEKVKTLIDDERFQAELSKKLSCSAQQFLECPKSQNLEFINWFKCL